MTNKTTTIVQCTDVHKIFTVGEIKVPALKNINLNIKSGEFTALVGPSGSGKTTLLNQIGCLDIPTKGSVLLDDVEVSTLNGDQRADLRRDRIGFIFQTFNLIPTLSARENVEFPLLIKKKRLDTADKAAVNDLLERFGLSEQKDKRPDQMSGGQRQRVAVARALIKKPSLILADEPTANLDSTTGKEVLELMRELNEELGMTFIFSTHDPMVMEIARRRVSMHDGAIAGDTMVSTGSGEHS